VYTTSAQTEELRNGLLFCRVESRLTGRRLVSLPFSDHCEPLVENLEELQQLLKGIQFLLKPNKWQYLEMRPLTASFVEGLEQYADKYFLHFLDLRPNLEELYHGLHVNSIRRKIQRGEREGLALEQGSTTNLLDQFYQLHLKTRRRQGIPPHPKVWFRNVLETFQGKAIIRIAKERSTPVAALMTIENDRSIIYKYGCSDGRFHNLGGMPFVFWGMIRDAKQRGFAQLDLGRSELSNAGLIAFKDRWGAAKQQLIYSRYPPRKGNITLRQKVSLRLAKMICTRSPDWLLATTGNLLYPHIG